MNGHRILQVPEHETFQCLSLTIDRDAMMMYPHKQLVFYVREQLDAAGFLIHEQKRFPITSREDIATNAVIFEQRIPMSRFLEPPPVNGSRIVVDNATGRVVRAGDVVYADDRPVGIALNAAPQDGHIEVQLGNVTTAAPRTPPKPKPVKKPEVHPVRTKRAINLSK